MDLHQKIRTLPTSPGCYLYKNAEGEVIYVGKAKNLRARVRSYFLDASQANAKTGTLMREAVDVDYITVANEHEALALENNLIKQRKPRFNILLRDDKTYPYIKLTLADRYPKVFVTRRLRRDGSAYFGPYFPGNLAHRLVDLIHRSFLIPSCKVDLSRYHPRACLQYYIKRCLGPCVESLTTPEAYAQTIHDVQLFLSGKPGELEMRLTARMNEAAAAEQFELAAKLRDQLITLRQMLDKQRIATTDNEDADVFGYHYENGMLAVNLFHMRGGKIVDRRDFFWEELAELVLDAPAAPDEAVESAEVSHALEPNPAEPVPEISDDSPYSEERSVLAEPAAVDTTDNGQRTTDNSFSPAAFFSSLLTQLYLDAGYVPRTVLVPVDFSDRTVLAELLAERCSHRVEILAPQRGDKRSLVDLVCLNAKQSYDQRFRVMQPAMKAIQEALADILTLDEVPRRIECFDISHIQGAETVASMVVWEEGAMKKSDYRKFQVRSVTGVDDFASMREVVGRRYKRLLADKAKMPSLILIDGGLGQLHAAAEALAEIGIQPGTPEQPALASIAKKEEVLYVYGQESEPVVLERRSPVLHLIQKIRDESHRFAVTYHRKRREMRDRTSEIDAIPGVGPRTRQRLLEHFGSVRGIRQASPDALTAVVSAAVAQKIRAHFAEEAEGETATPLRVIP
ncbi:MAG TPA: excinuclease ABC subunit UvrC [Acidobacteriaceae bacterium]|nr:excinuclease ABC subunit UvrC [Acidobacteriaceae bacterium]